MGYITTFSGCFTVEPPLTWAEIQQSPSWVGHPNQRDRGFSRDFYGTHLHITQEEVDTPEGVLIRRHCDLVTVEGDDLRANAVMNSLRRLASDFGADHEFTGHLTAEGEENSDIWRVKIVGREVVEDHAVVLWPGDDKVVKVVAASLMYATSGEMGECVKLAVKVLRDLADALKS